MPSSYLEYLAMLTDVFAECVRTLEPGRTHRGQRGQPRTQAVPQPLGRRDPDPRARPRAAAARRAHLAEGRRRQRIVRVGLVPQRGEPGAARHQRAGDRGQQGPVRSGPLREAASRRGPAPREHGDDRRLPGPHARRLVDPARERPPGRASRAVPGGASRAAHPALHVPTTISCSTRSWAAARRSWPRRGSGAVTSATTSIRPTSRSPGAAWRTRPTRGRRSSRPHDRATRWERRSGSRRPAAQRRRVHDHCS